MKLNDEKRTDRKKFEKKFERYLFVVLIIILVMRFIAWLSLMRKPEPSGFQLYFVTDIIDLIY